MMQDRIWYLLGRKMANELLPEEETELERLLQEYPDASYTKEVMMQPWKDKQKQLSGNDVEAALQRHKQRMAAMEQEPAPRISHMPRIMIRTISVAAAVLVLLFAGRMWMGYQLMQRTKDEAAAKPQQLVTKNGTRSSITLPDGTTVWLNAGSKLDYPQQFNGNKREVVLEGEAYFDVAPSADQPFIVKTKAFSVRVLGTTFNVRAYPKENTATTALITGSVEVVIDEKTVHRLLPNEKLSIPLEATTQQLKTVTSTIPNIKLEKLVPLQDNIIAETAWKDNKLAFKRLPLEEVARRMEQWYGARIRFKNENKKQLSFSGVFEKESLKEALRALELSGGFHFSQDADSVIWIE